ncbi:MAG: Serine/threonine-protein kinase pkn3, partial [Labilithrix sp.]|nr:Serine/threonine-protein kinase pkn3 [Labilithrix sp.]
MALERAEENPPFTDKYDVERVLGRGGMGTVFEARHSRLGHRVAIKVLGEDLRVHAELVTRFEREARAAGALSSPHAVKVFDIDQTEDGTPFMVMELLQGRDLAHLVENEGAQAIGPSVRWVIEACDAIGEAHRLGIIHRDIKPSNLFLCRDTGSIKVLDFGIAKRVAAKEAAITVGVAPLGTPQYMSPEQVRCAKDVDGRTDIWSLGVTLYELVCGRPPFNHDVPQACIAAIAADPIPDPREHADIPDELAAVILRALAKDPAERFQTVDELVDALLPFAEASPDTTDSWRAISTARRSMAKVAHTTVDGDSILALQLLDADTGSEEQTVPPAVSRASARVTRGKRVRSTIAVASAAVLGLAALVATPRCVGARLDAASSANLGAPPQVIEAVARPSALPMLPSAVLNEVPSSEIVAPPNVDPAPSAAIEAP